MTETIEAVRVGSGDHGRIGTDRYELENGKSLLIRYWWTTVTSVGTKESTVKTCDVRAQVLDAGTGDVVDATSKPNCSYDSGSYLDTWLTAPGTYRIAVRVILETGDEGQGSKTIEVVG